MTIKGSLFSFLLLTTNSLLAQEKFLTQHHFIPGISYNSYYDKKDNSKHTSYGIDLSYGLVRTKPKSYPPNYTFWVTGGFNHIPTVNSTVYYFEGGFWYFLNVGLGKSISDNRKEFSHFYIFTGLPIPIYSIHDSPAFIEPYGRFSLDNNESRIDNYGLLLKYVFLH